MMINAGTVIKTFSCPCREWTICRGDSPEAPNPTDQTFITHDCRDLRVYQEKRAVKRWYVKQPTLLANQTENEPKN